MPLLSSVTMCWFPSLHPPPYQPQKSWTARGCSRIRDLGFRAAAAGGSGSAMEFDVPFPSDYDELLEQAKKATELALKNNKQLMEIEFPTSGLDSVPGDGEGGIEMTGSLQLIREFCDLVVTPEKTTRTRVFLPEANEVAFARKSVFGGSSLKLDYLTKPSLLEDFGFVTKVKMADRVKPDDELFVVGYPYFNVNEMLVVEELYKEAVLNTSRKLIIFNGELDRIRSGCILQFNLTAFQSCRNTKPLHGVFPVTSCWLRLSGILLSETGCSHTVIVSKDGDGVLYSQLQRKEWRCPLQVIPWAMEGSSESEKGIYLRASTG